MFNWRFGTAHECLILISDIASADTVGLNTGLNLIYIYSLPMGAAMALANRHICTFSTEPLLCYTAISTKIKCAGSFDFFLALNQAKLNIL